MLMSNVISNKSRIREFLPSIIFYTNSREQYFLHEVNVDYKIKELQKILLKHPNRSDIRMELMKLKKLVKPKIGRKKKRK